MKKQTLFTLFIFLISVSIFASSEPAAGDGKLSVSVMTYNLENLFDTKHDLGKEDYTYLPLDFKNSSAEVQAYCQSLTNEYYKKSCLEFDWSQDIVDQKIKNLAKVILSYNNGQGADILVFEEVENKNILKQLISKGLANKGYLFVSLIEGPDTRGIDVGIISKYPIKKETYHRISMKPYASRTTRGILQTDFKVANKVVTIFANHWPSQSNPDGARLNAAKVLKKAALKTKSDLVLALGDFNTTSSDSKNGITQYILPIFYDVESIARTKYDIKAHGTHWYRGEWESLDKIFVLKASLAKNKVRPDYRSFEILNLPFMMKKINWTNHDSGQVDVQEIPNRFDTESGEGYSDHLPVGIRFNL